MKIVVPYRKNGALILVAKCGCGIGGKAFADLLGSSKTPKDALETIKKGPYSKFQAPF